jgi:hypothetical protein
MHRHPRRRIAMPNSARTQSRKMRFGEKADTSSRTEQSTITTTRIGRRPYRSTARPNTKAPTGRIASVTTMAKVTLVIGAPNSVATACTTKTIRKKSNASKTLARKLAITAPRCAGVKEPAAADFATAGAVPVAEVCRGRAPLDPLSSENVFYATRSLAADPVSLSNR